MPVKSQTNSRDTEQTDSRSRVEKVSQKNCDDFNEIPEGSMFKYFPFLFSKHSNVASSWVYARTVGQAFVSAGGVAVVFITDHDDYVPIEKLKFIK